MQTTFRVHDMDDLEVVDKVFLTREGDVWTPTMRVVWDKRRQWKYMPVPRLATRSHDGGLPALAIARAFMLARQMGVRYEGPKSR